LGIIWFLYITAEIIMLLYVFFKINPSFKNILKNISEIWSYNKSYGLNVYMGTLFAIGFAQLTGVLISYFSNDNAGVGYFSLALTITMPLSFIPNVISTTHYKDFSVAASIPRRLFVITLLLSGFALILLWLLIGPFIRFFYGDQFSPVISLTVIVSIGVALHGLADFFNRFLGSHGRGKELRNSSIIVGLSLMIFNFTLVPLFGETGAAYTRVITGIVYVLCMYWFYRKELVHKRD
jgi:O-antigen/teichoic acid export membrane protein